MLFYPEVHALGYFYARKANNIYGRSIYDNINSKKNVR